MADLLIKGMDMPPCGVYSAEIGVLDEKTAVIVICTPIGEPQRGYQLVEVPPHGRLIDADKVSGFLNEISNTDYNNRTWTTLADAYKDCVSIIDGCPTVVEASEDGEQITEKEKA